AAGGRAGPVRGEISQVRDVAETADAGLRALREELVGVRDEALSVRTELAAAREAAEAARADARRGDERVEAMQSELAYALASLDELKQGLSSAGQAAVIARREAEQARKAAQHAGDGSTSVTEVFQQILGMAASRGGGSGMARPRRAARGRRAPPRRRTPPPGRPARGGGRGPAGAPPRGDRPAGGPAGGGGGGPAEPGAGAAAAGPGPPPATRGCKSQQQVPPRSTD